MSKATISSPNFQKALHDNEYEELKESKLGSFIKFQELGFDWASRLVHYMLEFDNLTGLNCEYIEDLERPHCVVTKELTSFWEMFGVHVEAGPSTQEIIAAFERCEGWSRDDRSGSHTLPFSPDTLKEKIFNPTRGRDISGCYTINGFHASSPCPVYTALRNWVLIMKALHDNEYEESRSRLGSFIKFQELGFDWASRLVHYMLGFQLDIKEEDLERPHRVVTKELTSFGRCLEFMSSWAIYSEIIAAFERCEGWSRDDRKRLAYLAIFTGYIEGRKYSTLHGLVRQG
ncbi:hypothetical protein Bca52824_086889 [Brassica carinata]|uniref:DUF1985 domain-containing protein n=1 Tax=Brassica carinata TaxID=52824 RepID=A0A8X7TN29_BRACI|nr:hypothetical protein Bca52824_086889 [Brassica carinata]